MRALITGPGGFVAGHLARELHRQGWEVTGCGLLDRADGESDSDDHWQQLVEADITDPVSVRRVLQSLRPDAVFHLAGISSVSTAGRDPIEAFRVNCIGSIVLLQEIVNARDASGLDPFCLLVGSGEQYGRHEQSEMPLAESAELRPQSIYGASKCAQETAALQFHRAHAVRLVCTRSFNHSGPGQRGSFLLPSLVRRASELKRSGGSSLPVGNLVPVRDFLHVEDVARAYRLLVDRGKPGSVYNVCSGTGVSVEQAARLVLSRSGVDARLEVDPEFVRRGDVPVLVGSHERLTRDTGWRPEKNMNDIVEDLVSAATQ